MEDESVEAKKERMREYMLADRQLDAEIDKRKRRRRGGCFMSLFKAMLFMGVVGFVAYLISLWHPWSTEIVTVNAANEPGVCSPGVSGSRTTEYFTLFGIRLYQSGESTLCTE